MYMGMFIPGNLVRIAFHFFEQPIFSPDIEDPQYSEKPKWQEKGVTDTKRCRYRRIDTKLYLHHQTIKRIIFIHKTIVNE